MSRLGTLRSALLGAAISVLATPALAGSLTLSAVDSGNYQDTSSGASIEGFGNNNENYVAGEIGASTGFQEARNFFVFDLNDVSGLIVSASLHLTVPDAQFASGRGGYRSPDPTETLTLFDVSTDMATLRARGRGLTQFATFTDLGTGIAYGSVTMSVADRATVVAIDFNAAGVAALNAGSGLFALGGAVTTIRGTSDVETLFGGNGNIGSPVRELRLDVRAVPLPPAAWMGLGLFAGLGLLRRLRRRTRARATVRETLYE